MDERQLPHHALAGPVRVGRAPPHRAEGAVIGRRRRDLEERFKAAEKVCLLIGWSGGEDSERSRATTQAWMDWTLLVPEGFTSPRQHPELDDAEIRRLASRRQATRIKTLQRIREEMDERDGSG